MAEVQVGEVAPVVETVVEEKVIPEGQQAEPGAEPEEQKSETETETPEQQEQRKQSKARRRLDRARDRAVAAETEVKMLREQLANKQAAPKDEEPKRDAFESYEEYLDARTDYRATKAASKVVEAAPKPAPANAPDPAAQKWVEREAAYQKANPNYEDDTAHFVEEDLQSLSASSRRLILESDQGPALIHYLGKNSDVFDRIATLPAARQLAELGKLEDKVSAPPRKVTAAPAPASHVNSTRTGSKDVSKMNGAEVKALMKAEGSPWVR